MLLCWKMVKERLWLIDIKMCCLWIFSCSFACQAITTVYDAYVVSTCLNLNMDVAAWTELIMPFQLQLVLVSDSLKVRTLYQCKHFAQSLGSQNRLFLSVAADLLRNFLYIYTVHPAQAKVCIFCEMAHIVYKVTVVTVPDRSSL